MPWKSFLQATDLTGTAWVPGVSGTSVASDSMTLHTPGARHWFALLLDTKATSQMKRTKVSSHPSPARTTKFCLPTLSCTTSTYTGIPGHSFTQGYYEGYTCADVQRHLPSASLASSSGPSSKQNMSNQQRSCSSSNSSPQVHSPGSGRLSC